MQKAKPPKKQRPEQKIRSRQGKEEKMTPEPVYYKENRDKKLLGKVILITGGDSGIGRAVAVACAQEGADIAIVYKEDDRDAKVTKSEVELQDRACLILRANITSPANCKKVIEKVTGHFQKLDVLINNAAVQFPQKELSAITEKQLLTTFQTNIFSQFYMCQAAEPYLKKGSSIINTTSVTAYRGSNHLLDYSATKGAIVTFTRSLSAYFVDKGVRVNGVAPGPIWTPLIPTTFDPGHVASFGSEVPMARAGQPVEVAGCYVFLASDDSSYMTGQVLHPNGGEIING
ncbi:SDR family oxidoreductase [Danxiaibacter flavus]|uniref:SDR family oxidoreductase n=1 Tax=Danxiaibacter flavus TaxID=3049108 RepID=A0ABV3ZJT9_9BACT|nr:SDR family oxidoreductase [Chitinophagaceae bacterium DXS]